MSKTLFYGSLATETNSFSNIPTTYASFEQAGLYRGRDVIHRFDGSLRPGFEQLIALASAAGLTVVPGISANAAPGAPTQHADYVRLRDELLFGLSAAMPVAAVLLFLHGAMISTECLDCEGDMLSRVRKLVGPATPIGAVLDPHAHLTSAMVDAASLLVFMKEYPHTDGQERLVEVLRVLVAMLAGAPPPVAAVVDCRWIGVFPTLTQPMRGFVDRLFDFERTPGITSISFIHGFPWGDTPDTGARVLVYAEQDKALATQVARTVCADIWSLRDQLVPPGMPLDEALARIGRGSTPLLIADTADNPGGGAPSDSTFILRAALAAGLQEMAIGMVFDPEAVRACHQVGVGGHLVLRVGGKISRFSGEPVDLEAHVRGLSRNAVMDVMGLAEFAMGDTAWIHAQGIDIVLCSIRVQTYSPEAFTHLGIDLTAHKTVVIKSSTHFQAAFARISDNVVHVTTPGALDFDFARLPYLVFKGPFYPRDRVTPRQL